MASVEMQPTKTGASSRAEAVYDGREKGYGNESKVARAYAPNSSSDSASLRRLFSFAQLLAFALTFMESWEVIAMSELPLICL